MMLKPIIRIAALFLLVFLYSPAYTQSGRAKRPEKKTTVPPVPVDTTSISPPEPKEKLPETVDGERIYTGKEVDKKVFIISKPAPHYPENARRAGIKGKVTLRAILAADGQVRHIEVLSGLPMGLNAESMASATQIKFLPARKSGVAVSMWVKLVYTFWVSDNSYPRWP
jgi:TonB family protein